MEMIPVTSKDTTEIETLETEVKKFADGLPYWGRYLAEKILSGKIISDSDIETSYSYLLEQLGLKLGNEKPEIEINYNAGNSTNHKLDLLLTRLENIKGVNALAENQCIEFSKNLTIIYGANGSGKSSYVRLFKKAFLSKAPEDILPNIYVNGESNTVDATFFFNSNADSITLNYSTDQHSAEFQQFAVFDEKSAIKHLTDRNEFEFKPAGLSFFADYTEVVNRVEQKLKSDIESKSSTNEFIFWFEGESVIKVLIENLSASTKIEDLSKYTPFSEQEKAEKQARQKQYNEFLVASMHKESEIKKLQDIKKLLEENKKKIEILNKYFSIDKIDLVKQAITDYIEKEAHLKAEGITKFATNKIEGIGTKEWKTFILSAEKFAKHQNHENHENSTYPEQTDNCLLCHQPLSDNAQELINNYWIFINSAIEAEEKEAKQTLDNLKGNFEELNFDLFSDENILVAWLNDKYPSFLEELKQTIDEQRTLCTNIIFSIQNKIPDNIGQEIKISVSEYENINTAIDSLIITFKEDQQSEKLETLSKSIKYLEHKEKLNLHFSNIEVFIKDQAWIEKANRSNFTQHKRNITKTEKNLSKIYFNDQYKQAFNEECLKLEGNFKIEINTPASGGKSYKELKLKGRTPNNILSEGEQKVIAIADFITEMNLSKINRGIIFDDPVTSLDGKRKSKIAERLLEESLSKQVIIFTHDLVFISHILNHSENIQGVVCFCHWIESVNSQPGKVWLNNSPCHEKQYDNANRAREYYTQSNKEDCPPMQREWLLMQGFAALRTSYEVLVISKLLQNVVFRFQDRVSVDALLNINIQEEIKNEIHNNFAECCRYMEGHTHSNQFAYKKIETKDLLDAIEGYEKLKKRITKSTEDIKKQRKKREVI
jgi:energy-coupling factor transporter ATP-binding protein EcfA2